MIIVRAGHCRGLTPDTGAGHVQAPRSSGFVKSLGVLFGHRRGLTPGMSLEGLSA